MGIILYDWLSFTSKSHSLTSIIDFLGLLDCKFVDMYGMRTYRNRMYFNGISIHYNSERNEGVWVEMSGQGCRAFEEYSDVDWSVVFSEIIDNDDFNVTRLDVAYDDKDGILDIEHYYYQTDLCNFVSKFRKITLEKEVKSKAITIYYGSKSSNIMFRMYDKAKERSDKGKEYLGHWVRFEIQLRDERALEFIKLPYDSVGQNFLGVVTNYLRYIVPSGDSNKSRCKTADYWCDFVGDVGKISLYTPCDTDYNLDKIKSYVYSQPANAIDTIIKIDGVEKFLTELKENKPARNKKYEKILAECGA